MTEQWRPVVGFEDLYHVSSEGRIRRFSVKLRKPAIDRSGYAQVNLGRNGGKTCKKVHSLVAEAFIGVRPYGFHVNHKDGNKTNNRPDNLEYITNCENIKHAVKLGLFAKGENNGAAKLTPKQVQEIRSLYVRGSEKNGTHALARRFHMSQYAINRIVTYKNWKHLPKILTTQGEVTP